MQIGVMSPVRAAFDPFAAATGARGGAAHSASRVAQAGNGNSIASGTGISGCETNMAPGLASVARSRCEAGRNPYSVRPASAGSRRPTTRMAELDTMRRSTSLAVCCAPMRMMPSDRPRSAMSSSTSLIGELPSRGAYLFSSSIIVNSSPPGPAASLRAVSAASTTPTTNRCARSCRLCRSTTVSCWSCVETAPCGGPPQVAADERAQRPHRRAQPADERVDRPHPGDRARPGLRGSSSSVSRSAMTSTSSS